MNHPTWQPATIPATPPVDPDPRSKPIDFSLTAAERDIAVLANLEILAMHRKPFTPGLEVKHLDPSELTDEQRKALGLEGVLPQPKKPRPEPSAV